MQYQNVIAILGFALATTACGSDAKEEAKAPLDFGLLTALSGDLAGLGNEYTDATKLALAEINDSGGVLGRQVRIALEDDGTEVATAELGYSALLDRSVPVILGPSFSAAVVATAPLIKSGRTLTIGQDTTSPALTTLDDGGFFFRVVASDLVQAKVLGDLILESKSTGFGLKELCIVYRDDAYGSAYEAATRARIEKLDPSITFVPAAYDALQTDLSKVLDPCGDPVQKTGSTAILFITFVADGAALVNDAIARGWGPKNHRFFFTDGAQDPLLFTLLDNPGSIDGARGIGPSGPDPATAAGDRLRNFQTRFTAFFNRKPTFYAENAYDAVYIAAMATEIAGTASDREAIMQAMGKVSHGSPVAAGDWTGIRKVIKQSGEADYQGASGDVNIDPANGDVLPPYNVALWSVVESAMVIVEIRQVDAVE